MVDATPPRVFISYSHDSDEHRDRVLGLADRLRADGIDAMIDQYIQSPPEGWTTWCEGEIRKASFVPMVCTETYLRRVNGEEEPGKGYGVLWEARLIRQHVYDSGSVSSKFVPVLFADGSHDHVPTPVKGGSIYRVESDEGYEGLYRLLTNQPRVRMPVLGKLRQLPDRQRVSLGEPPTGTVTGEQTRPVAPVATSTSTTSPVIVNQVGSVDRRRDPELADLQVFRDAPFAPEMVVIPAGEFWMGSQEVMSRPSEKPQHQVVVKQRFAIGRYPVTFDEYDYFCQLEYKEKPKDEGWGRGRMPVINVSWIDVQAYIAWLSRETSRDYRLPSEAEWEFACRAGTTTPFSIGDEPTPQQANFSRSGINQTSKVGAYPPNPWVSTTCMATSGNTSRTSGMRIIRARRSTAPHGRRKALLPRSPTP
jgi:Sulfatase-modifying factor enzyme 1/TIR domain